MILMVALAGARAFASPSPAMAAGQLISQNCVACHSESLRTAGVSLEKLDPSNVAPDAELWEKVLQKVGAGEMPPAGVPGPDPDTAKQFTAWLEQALDAQAQRSLNPGRTTVHRLNRAEFSNAVRDLLALDIHAGDMLPADDSGYGFDNIAQVLSLSPVRLERYMSAARRISRLATGNPDVKTFKDTFRRNRETGFLEAGYPRDVQQDLPFGARGGTSLHYYFPLDAIYEIGVDLGNDDTGPRPYKVRRPIKAGMRTIVATFLGESTKPEEIAPLSRFGQGKDDQPPPPMDIRLDGKRLQLFDLPAGDGTPKLASITVEGPFDVQGPGDSASRRKIFTCHPASQEEEGPCARRILSRLARHAYRRPVTDDDVSPLMALYQIGRDEGGFERGIEKALQGLLVSPHFLFRAETDPKGLAPATAYRVSDLELASRLSFFLWSSIPDEELLTLAEQGRLSDPEVYKQQIRRMLEDRRSQALVENFAGQWLFLRNVKKVKPDAEVFPEFDADLRQAMERETQLFFESILREDRSVLTLLTADYTFLNETLAKHYGIAGVHGPQFRKVRLEDSPRGGLLGQASILTVTSYPNRTSVVKRGKWVLENLLGTPPPPPPPDVPALEAEKEGGKHLTLRQAMEMHRANPTCASCHARMDPVGFALENFDAIGRWRKDDQGAPIDATGKFPGGASFEGPSGLSKLLADQHRDQFVATIAEKLLTYALGRGVEYYDKPAIRSIVADAGNDDYRLPELITAVAESVPFQMRRTSE